MRNYMRKALLVVIAFTLILIPNGLTIAASAPSRGGTMVVGISTDPGTLNGAISGSFFDKIVASNVFSMLIRLDRNMKPVPDLAKEWTVSQDGLTYTFHLVSGAKWHDGKPVTSEDVKFTVEDVIMKLHPRAGTYSQFISGVDTPDPHTVVFTLKKPFGALMNGLGYDFFILPKHVYSGTDVKNNPANVKPIGSGPFKFREWLRGSHITLERNPAYFRKDLPYLDRLVFRIIPDASSRTMALEAGDIDYLAYLALPSSAVPRLKAGKNMTVTQDGLESLASILMLTFNLDRDVLKDARVRQAIAHAIDRQYLVDYADYGLGRPATGPISSLTTWAYEPNVRKYEYNPALAERLLDEANYKPGPDGVRLTLRLIADTGVELNRKSAEIIKEQLRQVGIKVDLQLAERGVMLDRVYTKRDYDMHVHGFSTGADPAIDVARLYVSSNIRPVSFTNGSGYRNPLVDELFQKGEASTKVEDRARHYREVQKILVSDLPVIHLVEYGTTAAWNSHFHGLHEWSAYSYYIFWDAWRD
jgi:peptide/nickel transport system substrate-binding protein